MKTRRIALGLGGTSERGEEAPGRRLRRSIPVAARAGKTGPPGADPTEHLPLWTWVLRNPLGEGMDGDGQTVAFGAKVAS